MRVQRAESLEEAYNLRSQSPGSKMIHGGTDVMVELNFDRHRPEVLLDLSAIPELQQTEISNGHIEIGAGATCADIIALHAGALPALTMACRTIGSPQIRNRATLGGNLGTSSPAGDALPALVACGATVRLVGVRGERVLPVSDFIIGPGKNRLESDEIIQSIQVPRAAGAQHFAKVGARNAMVISIASFAIAIDVNEQRVTTGLGAIAPTPVSALGAEQFADAMLDWQTIGVERPTPTTLREFGALVAAAATPIDDLRASAAYRLRVLSVIASRALSWAWMSSQGASKCA